MLVRTSALSLNNADLSVSGDAVLGNEFSGVVEAVGPGVDAAVVGRRVMGVGSAAFAEHVVSHHLHILEVPESVSSQEAAALPTALLTGFGALRRGGIQTGDTVLVTAATSGIGLVSIQVARVLGAGTMIGTTRSAERGDLLRQVGVDHVVVTDEEDLASRVRDLTVGAGADLVLDHVAGRALSEAIEAARTGGSVVSVGRLAGRTAEIDLFRLAARAVTLRSVSFGFTPPHVIGDLLRGVSIDVLPAVQDARIRPVVDSVFAFRDAAAAFHRLRSGRAGGKVLLDVDAA